jgi:RNA polymerase subunit RPABC4/transcription elongation factor Spt4
MRQAPGEAVQKLCPRCSALAFTDGPRCPWCGGGYRRRRWPALLVLALVQTAVTLAGVAAMLLAAGNELDRRLDDEVRGVRQELNASFDSVTREVRRELDRRLPAP